MTTWLLGHFQGWRVAVARAAVTDNIDQYNLGDANVGRANGFGGSRRPSSCPIRATIA
jgi:hypothetical protein